MSNGFQDNQPPIGAVDSTGLAQLFRQIMIMPFSTVSYSMQILMWLLQGMVRMSNEGMNAVAGGATQTLGGMGMPTSADATTSDAGNTQPSNRKEETKMSEQSWNSGDEAWSMSEACKDKDPCDRLRLVRFKVLFLKDKLEHAFPEEEELVSEDITRDGFISWKVAEFIQKLGREEVRQPRKWYDKNNYPANDGGRVAGAFPKSYIIDLPDKDKKYLRVYSDVLAWYDREKKNYERDKVDALEEIRDVLRDRPFWGPGSRDQTQVAMSAEEPGETEATPSTEEVDQTQATPNEEVTEQTRRTRSR